MASHGSSRRHPTTDRERELLDDLAGRLLAVGLTADIRHDRREVTAKQPAVAGAGVIAVGLSQVVILARSTSRADHLAWLITLDDGFRGANGSRYEQIAEGDDVETAARKLGHILALAGSREPAT